jgi:hypothetical protein
MLRWHWRVGPTVSKGRKREKVPIRGGGILGRGPALVLGRRGSPCPLLFFKALFFFFSVNN